MKPLFFKSPAEWRRWLQQNHEREDEVLLGFYKRDSGKPSVTWPESVDQALCFGWIDGVRRSSDSSSYTIRFTPRRRRSIWSKANVKRAGELIASGLMEPAGIRAFEARQQERSGVYSFEQDEVAFDKRQEQEFRREKAAWRFFQSQAPWYRRTATFWVISAKREETKAKRLRILIEDSACGRTIGPLTRRKPGDGLKSE
jgi:uncharacterized protein YdeI (YjbR/CyaY-like superfamily)